MQRWRHHDGPRPVRARFPRLPALAVVLAAGAALSFDHGGTVSVPLVGYGTGGSYAATGSPAGITLGITTGAAPVQSSTSRGYFRISGGVAGLYPGVVKPYVLSVYNPNPFQITVTSISAAVTSPAAGCAASNLAVTAFSGHLIVPGGHIVHTTVAAKMAHSAPNQCQGVVFTLNYTGVGTIQ
jgi:hypothetical protein